MSNQSGKCLITTTNNPIQQQNQERKDRGDWDSASDEELVQAHPVRYTKKMEETVDNNNGRGTTVQRRPSPKDDPELSESEDDEEEEDEEEDDEEPVAKRNGTTSSATVVAGSDATNRALTREVKNLETSGLDEYDEHSGMISDDNSMQEIDKSPYEPSQNAEKGEKLFIDMKSLLSECSDDNYRSVDPQAAKIFGPTIAWSLVKANKLIEKSGMVYSAEWTDGNFRGTPLGKIPKDYLLLCLVSKRFAKAGELLLAGICRDLEVYNIVKDALKEWGLDEEFKFISACSKNFLFGSKKRDCYKCEIFVARAFSISKVFGIKCTDDEILFAKIRSCLKIMESHMPDPKTKKKRKSQPSPTPPSSSNGETPTTATAKKRRGRTRNTTPDGKAEGDDSSQAAEADNVPIPTPTVSSGKPGRPRKRGKPKVDQAATLATLVAKFEEQYEEVGQKYREMGETLAELKSKVFEDRASTEREIRSELMFDVAKFFLCGREYTVVF